MHIGSLVECTWGGGWEDTITREPKPGPAAGDILTVSGFDKEVYLMFEEWPQVDWDGEQMSFHRKCFRELQPPITVQIEELISETQTA